LMIEFQGGEPLLNWPVVKFIVGYARKKNGFHKKALHFGLISNFSLLEDEHIDFAATAEADRPREVVADPVVKETGRLPFEDRLCLLEDLALETSAADRTRDLSRPADRHP